MSPCISFYRPSPTKRDVELQERNSAVARDRTLDFSIGVAVAFFFFRVAAVVTFPPPFCPFWQKCSSPLLSRFVHSSCSRPVSSLAGRGSVEASFDNAEKKTRFRPLDPLFSSALCCRERARRLHHAQGREKGRRRPWWRRQEERRRKQKGEQQLINVVGITVFVDIFSSRRRRRQLGAVVLHDGRDSGPAWPHEPREHLLLQLGAPGEESGNIRRRWFSAAAAAVPAAAIVCPKEFRRVSHALDELCPLPRVLLRVDDVL